jgi:hypothetical protein
VVVLVVVLDILALEVVEVVMVRFGAGLLLRVVCGRVAEG